MKREKEQGRLTEGGRRRGRRGEYDSGIVLAAEAEMRVRKISQGACSSR